MDADRSLRMAGKRLESVVVVPREEEKSESRRKRKRVELTSGLDSLRDEMAQMRKNFGDWMSQMSGLVPPASGLSSQSHITSGLSSQSNGLSTVSSGLSTPHDDGLSSLSSGLSPNSAGSSLSKRVCKEGYSSRERQSSLSDIEDLAPSTVIPVLEDEPDLGLDLNGEDLHEHMAIEANMADEFSLPVEGGEVSGPKLPEKLAQYVETCVSKRIDKDHLKSLKQSAKRPDNCPLAVVPQVNPGIWRDLEKFQKTRDVQMQSTQDLVVRSLYLLTDVRHALSESSNPKDLERKCNTIIALLGNASLELSFRRRELLRSSLNKKYHSLCSPNTPVGKSLFGDSMSDELKSINEVSRVAKGVVSFGNNKGDRSSSQAQPSRGHGGGRAYAQSHRSLNWQGRPTPFRGRSQFRQSSQKTGSQETTKKSA